MNWKNRAAIAALICAAPLWGQENRGTILGRVADPSGASVSGATVEALNVDTNVSIRSTTNASGNYQIPFLNPGDYAVRVELAGFKGYERSGVRVATNTQTTIDILLELGSTAETVTVTASSPLLDTATADLGQVVDRRHISTTTVNLNRNVLNAVLLTPGVSGGGAQVGGNNSGSFSISGGGSTVGRVEFLVDGIPNSTAHNNGGVVFIPSIDAVEEIKVHTTMFDAQYGHSNGGAINITTKGGTNQFHGTTYLFKRWAALNANSWTNNSRGLPKVQSNYRQYGYLVSGPVILPKLYNGRNKTFFSTTLEDDASPSELTRRARVPTAAERAGDFSQTVNRRGGAFTLYDPATTVVTGNRAARQPFAGNRIPASRLNPVGVAWMKLFPEPNLSNTSQLEEFNWIATGLTQFPQTQYSFRVDHYLSDKQRFFLRYGLLKLDQTNAELIRGQHSIAPQGTSGLARENTRRFHNFGFDDTYTFSPSLIGSFRYGYVRKLQLNLRGAVDYDAGALNLPSVITANQAVAGWPTFNIGENVPTLGSNFVQEANDLHSFMATFTKLTGKHSLKWGADWRVLRWNRNSPGDAASGNFTFNNTFTRSDPFTPTTADSSGSGMASLLLGLPATGSLGFISALSMQNHYLGMFVQEDWKVNRMLTLNFGVRWEMETPYTERYDRMGYGFDESAAVPLSVPGFELKGGVTFANAGGNPRRGGVVDLNNFGPRFGFALHVLPKTVIRGGYGMFFSGQAYNTGFLGDVGVFNATTPFVGTVDNGATAFTTISAPFPNGLRAPVGAAAGLLAQVGDALTFFNERRVSPYNQQWQFSVQRELPSQAVIEAAYVGMLTLKQFENFNLNEKPDAFLPLGTAENQRVPNPFLGVFPASSTLGQGATITQNRLWVRFPQFTNLNIQGANTGKAIYHALQMKLDKRLSRGLSVLGSYTFSKLIDNETTSVINPRKYRTVSSLDQTHVMRLGATYDFPWRFVGGGGMNRVLRQVAGGWSLSGFLVMNSGTPLGITHANGRPVRIRNAALSGPVSGRLGDRLDPATRRPLNPYFDINAFQPLASQFIVSPEAARFDELRAPGDRSLNMSLFKVFPLTERLKLQMRLEAAGVTNTPNFDPPGTNMNSLATFGIINAAGGSRTMQASARVSF